MSPPKLDLKVFHECGISFEADSSSSSPRKTPFYYNSQNALTRSLVLSVLKEYINSEQPVCYPVKCIDVIGSVGTNGLLWKKHLTEKVDVKVNAPDPESTDLISKNALRNHLKIDISSKDPCIVLYERGYNFIKWKYGNPLENDFRNGANAREDYCPPIMCFDIFGGDVACSYLDCTNDASHYLDAAFRNISRNGVLVVSGKDDSSMHGTSPEVAMRRYAGRITRCLYYHELGIRLILAAMVRNAAKYNKCISPICCFMDKSVFTIAVISRKGPELANEAIKNIRLLKHCMVCEERKFYPVSSGFPYDPEKVKLDCNCGNGTNLCTNLELGPLWAGPIFSLKVIQGMLSQENLRSELKAILQTILLEAECSSREGPSSEKKLKTEAELIHPPFYFNIHKHHPRVDQLVKLTKVIEALKSAGYRASKTHFDKLAIRTDAPINKFLEIVSNLCK